MLLSQADQEQGGAQIESASLAQQLLESPLIRICSLNSRRAVSFEVAYERFYRCDCEDSRDRVYGILSLTTASPWPDYRISCFELAAKAISLGAGDINLSQSSAILAGLGVGFSNAGMLRAVAEQRNDQPQKGLPGSQHPSTISITLTGRSQKIRKNRSWGPGAESLHSSMSGSALPVMAVFTSLCPDDEPRHKLFDGKEPLPLTPEYNHEIGNKTMALLCHNAKPGDILFRPFADEKASDPHRLEDIFIVLRPTLDEGCKVVGYALPTTQGLQGVSVEAKSSLTLNLTAAEALMLVGQDRSDGNVDARARLERLITPVAINNVKPHTMDLTRKVIRNILTSTKEAEIGVTEGFGTGITNRSQSNISR